MNIFTMLETDNLPFELDCDLAVMYNLKGSKHYNDSYKRVRQYIIENHFGDFEFDEVHINIEIKQILEIYGGEC